MSQPYGRSNQGPTIFISQDAYDPSNQAGIAGKPAMHVQLSGDRPSRVVFRNFERRLIGGQNPWIVTGVSEPVLAADRAKLRREAVRRGDRQRAALRRAFEGEG